MLNKQMKKSQAFEASRRGGYDDTPAYAAASHPKDTKNLFNNS